MIYKYYGGFFKIFENLCVFFIFFKSLDLENKEFQYLKILDFLLFLRTCNVFHLFIFFIYIVGPRLMKKSLDGHLMLLGFYLLIRLS